MASGKAEKINQINIKVSELSKTVSEINELANKVRICMKDDYYTGMVELSNAWAGDTSKDFMEKSQTVLNETAETSVKISEATVKAVEMIKRYAVLEAAAYGIQLNLN